VNRQVIIIGGGAAGMLSALGALEKGVKPVILEKMPRLGTKMLITGKGRCNITNSTDDLEDFITNMPGNGQFLYSAIYNFTNQDMIDFLNKLGLPTKIERGGRVFPQSDKAADVVNSLEKYLVSKNVKINLNTYVKELLIKNGKILGVKTQYNIIEASAVIIATGGVSYPKTGSTGEGYKLAKMAGHTVVSPESALVPLETEDEWVNNLQGLTLKNVQITVYEGNKSIESEFGEMMFTHFGVSGPIILKVSKTAVKALKRKKYQVKISINLKPALTSEQLENRIMRDFEKYSRKQFKNSLNELLPKSLIAPLMELSGINPEKYVNQITRKERNNFTKLLQNLTVTIKKPRPISEAIVTSGGINVDEVNPGTMESKLVQGLYFAGEVLDVDGYTGGFNLQTAFSTGFLAGSSAALNITKK
jgi:hypothetical protein